MSQAPIGRIEAPLVNANEPEAVVIELHVQPFAAVARGDHLCTLETSKATVEVESEYDGFTGPVSIVLDGRVMAGDLICEVFAERPDPAASAPAAGDAAGGRRITKKAQALADELGVDAAALAGSGFVTEREVRAAAVAAAPADVSAIAPRIHERAIILYGGGGLAKMIIDLTRADPGGFEVIGIVDDAREPGTEVLGVPVVGGRAHLPALAEAGLVHAANAIGAIGRMAVRVGVSEQIAAAGLRGPVLIDRTASVAASATLAEGALIFAGAIVSADARVGAHTIVNSGAIVSHDCVIGANSHIAPGAILAGEVTVGAATLVGMAVTAPIGITIGDGAIVGNGATLRGDVPAGAVVAAGSIWPAS